MDVRHKAFTEALESFSYLTEVDMAGHLLEDDYVSLIAAIDDRNKLSHIYDPEAFAAIVVRLPDYAKLMQQVSKTLDA